MQKDGEPSVEEILRSIKKVISREDEGYRDGDYRDGGYRETRQDLPPATDGTPTSGPFQAAPSFGSVRAFAPRDAFGRPTFGPTFGAAPTPANAEANAEATQDEVYDLGTEPEVDEAPDMTPPPLPAGFEPPAALAELADEGESEDGWSQNGEPVTGAAPTTPSHAPLSFAARPEAEPEPEREQETGAVSEPEPEPAPEPVAPAVSEGLIAGTAAAAMRDQLGALSSLTAAAAKPDTPPNPLEEMIRDMLRPMLKDWLDANLQGIIERMVQDEIARITGRR